MNKLQVYLSSQITPDDKYYWVMITEDGGRTSIFKEVSAPTKAAAIQKVYDLHERMGLRIPLSCYHAVSEQSMMELLLQSKKQKAIEAIHAYKHIRERARRLHAGKV